MSELRVQPSKAFTRNLIKTFSVVNPTAGTGIAEAVKDAFAATAATAVLRNTGVGFIRPQYLRMIARTVPASAASVQLRVALDKGVTRWASGGSSLTPVNRDISSAVASAATFRFGALVTDAATANVRYVSAAAPSSVIPVAGDELVITFGEREIANMILGGTVARRIVTTVAPVILGRNTEMLIHQWYPSNSSTAAVWEIEACWQESTR